MTRERRFDFDDWPEWLHRSWCLDPKVQGSVYCLQDRHRLGPSEEIYVHAPDGVHEVLWDDFIILDLETGSVTLLGPDDFEEKYEETGDEH
jgi:hypothetical protein